MQILIGSGVLLVSYVLGSIPMGLIIVHLKIGKDIRGIESGRTGGTNAMRAAGFWAGFATGFGDLIKSALAVWFAQLVAPEAYLLHALAPVAAILGHNYSIFLIERNERGQLKLRGGAGGAPTLGGAFALWPFSLPIILPLATLILFGVGYASLTTLSIGFLTTLIFIILAWLGVTPWIYVLYGVLASILLMWALRPNIRRLLNGTERVVGWRARRNKNPHVLIHTGKEQRLAGAPTQTSSSSTSSS
jgi:glycerol-3-phosphate acyltransferase PlsY